jgi:mycothiol system anti-sigma-R factor
MSCDDGEDDECAQALARVYEYLDGEMSPADLHQIREHLDDCAPCLKQYDLDVALKALIRRSCRESAPADLRERIMLKITEIRIEIGG